MRLGTIVGGKAWADLNDAARAKRQAEAKLRKDKFDKAKRWRELDAAGFKPISSRAYDVSDSCAVGTRWL
jgi:hypothetical protein